MQTDKDDRIKVEIRKQDTGEWQWMGLMTEKQLTKLTELADEVSDGEHDD